MLYGWIKLGIFELSSGFALNKTFWLCLEIPSYVRVVFLKYFWKNWNNPAKNHYDMKYAFLCEIVLLNSPQLALGQTERYIHYEVNFLWEKEEKTCARTTHLCRRQYQVITPAKFSVKISHRKYIISSSEISFLVDCFVLITIKMNQGFFVALAPQKSRGLKYAYKKKVLIPAPKSLQSRNKLQLDLFLRSTNMG